MSAEKREIHPVLAGRRLRLCFPIVKVLAATCLLAGMSHADPPLDPLDPPLYSFDDQSPKVLNGSVNPGDLLSLNIPIPDVAISASSIGLTQPADELDGLSSSNTGFPVALPFSILFSIDRTSQALALPDPIAVGFDVPYNAADQAGKGQQAGDQYMSLNLFTRGGIIPPTDGVAVASDNNTLVRNNYDEGGTDLAADPETSAEDSSNDPQDNVDATKKDGTTTIAGGTLSNAVYFTARRGSPSLKKLSSGAPPSGASLFFVLDPTGKPPSQPELFAPFFALGLVEEDDINAFIVFDDDANGAFSVGDQVIFSLTPDSPSATTIPNNSGLSAGADLFSVTFQPPPDAGTPQVYATAFQLGLGSMNDNIDALEFFECDDTDGCAALRGIRRPGSGIPTVSTWGMILMGLFITASATLIYARRRRLAGI